MVTAPVVPHANTVALLQRLTVGLPLQTHRRASGLQTKVTGLHSDGQPPFADEHTPALHEVPIGQMFPQNPQFALSRFALVQTPAQSVAPGAQGEPDIAVLHRPPEQIVPGEQTSPQAPQLFGSVTIFVAHVAPPIGQVAIPAGQVPPGAVQTPPLHTEPAGQVMDPQGTGAPISGTHTPDAQVEPCGHGNIGHAPPPAVEHTPTLHVVPPVQIFPHVPQLLGSDRVSAHVPPHNVLFAPHGPTGAPHAPAAQIEPTAQRFPQVPQLLASV